MGLLSTLLLTGDELGVTDLARPDGLAHPTAHREVVRLADAGILSEQRVGRTRLIRAHAGSSPVRHRNDIDVMVLGESDLAAVYEARRARIETAVHRR